MEKVGKPGQIQGVGLMDAPFQLMDDAFQLKFCFFATFKGYLNSSFDFQDHHRSSL
ncbi:hypothetical protein [Flagellimonas sp.]|uniref:hypothetical protein n=1 Tax=Flagellimonas sp. TaxID=2058762 RepID=UPI003BB1DDC2